MGDVKKSGHVAKLGFCESGACWGVWAVRGRCRGATREAPGRRTRAPREAAAFLSSGSGSESPGVMVKAVASFEGRGAALLAAGR